MSNISKELFSKKTIFKINNEAIDDSLTDELLKRISMQNEIIGLDMSQVKTINSRLFLKSILEDKFKMFNIRNEILAYFFIVLKNTVLNAYLTKNDFISNKRELVKRNFIIV